MKYSHRCSFVVLGIVAAILAQGAGASPILTGDGHGHEGDFIVGRSADGRLMVEFDFDEMIPLEPVDEFIDGWALDEPGFASLEKDEPDEEFFTLGDDAFIVFEAVEFDPALKAWTPGFADLLEGPGDTWEIGAPEFDEHLIWHIDSMDPEFDNDQEVWMLRFRLIDTGGTGYEPTEVMTAMFTRVPEPGALALLTVGAFMALKRKRRG